MINVVLFDLGGVLIELPPMASFMARSALSETELKSRWLTSRAVRDFESGRSTPERFGTAAIAEFELAMSAGEFIERFTGWPQGPMPGARDTIEKLRARHHVACLSNTNALHWERFDAEHDLPGWFDTTFASHHLGMMKPDPEIYEHVVAALDVDPSTIAFFDDNAVNVEAASGVGLTARLARGPQDVSRHLASLMS